MVCELVRASHRRAASASARRVGHSAAASYGLLVATVGSSELARLERVWADQGYTGAFPEWLRVTRGWRLEAVRHPESHLWRYGLEAKPRRTFRVLPRRWVVDCTFAWLGQSRRLNRDYERLPAV